MFSGATERIPTETFAKPITDAARHVRARLPRSNTIELADLVQVGWERVTRYLSGAAVASTTLVFVCAKQGMVEEAARWASNAWAPDSSGKPRRTGKAPAFTGVHEWHRTTTLDVDLLIDIKRTLLSMPLREAASWYSRHMLDERVGSLGPEFGVSRSRICQYELAARAKLQAAVA